MMRYVRQQVREFEGTLLDVSSDDIGTSVMIRGTEGLVAICRPRYRDISELSLFEKISQKFTTEKRHVASDYKHLIRFAM